MICMPVCEVAIEAMQPNIESTSRTSRSRDDRCDQYVANIAAETSKRADKPTKPCVLRNCTLALVGLAYLLPLRDTAFVASRTCSSASSSSARGGMINSHFLRCWGLGVGWFCIFHAHLDIRGENALTRTAAKARDQCYQQWSLAVALWRCMAAKIWRGGAIERERTR